MRLLIIPLLLLSACDAPNAPAPSTVAPEVSDAAVQAQVQAALRNASDLPGSNFLVAVAAGVVSISGSLACETCGGYSTPGGVDNVQMTLGAVVRAVPGVREVHFQLNP